MLSLLQQKSIWWDMVLGRKTRRIPPSCLVCKVGSLFRSLCLFLQDGVLHNILRWPPLIVSDLAEKPVSDVEVCPVLLVWNMDDSTLRELSQYANTISSLVNIAEHICSG